MRKNIKQLIAVMDPSKYYALVLNDVRLVKKDTLKYHAKWRSTTLWFTIMKMRRGNPIYFTCLARDVEAEQIFKFFQKGDRIAQIGLKPITTNPDAMTVWKVFDQKIQY